jgi:predicted MPP superfamily phosphohydrolase
MTTALTEPVRMVAWLGRVVRARRRAPSDGPAEPVRDEKRRLVLSQALGGAAAALGLATAVAGRREADALRVVRVRAPLRRLPEAMSGTRIAQITDLHFGGSIGPEYLARVVEMVNALEPDLVAITGDLVDGPARTVAAGLAPLAGLRARHGVFYVTGNHEYYHGAAEWVVALSKLGVRVLSNERVEVGEPGASFDLAGVHDRSAAHYRIGHTQDLPAALAGRDPEREVVLLAHQPVIVRDAAKHDVGLVLSGHTHGGQLAPYKFALLLEQPFVDGLHRLGDTLIYVSRGAGYWGPKLRVLAPPEIAEITLLRA